VNEDLRISSGKWTGYEPLYLAREIGAYKRNALEVAVERDLNEEQTVERLQMGELDGAALTLDMLFILKQTNIPLKAVLILDYSLGGDVIIGRQGINELSDLRGKKIGIEKLYANQFFLARALAERNIRTSDVEIVEIKAEEHSKALKKGTVDAVAVYNPQGVKLEQDGYKELFSSKDLPSSIVDVLTVTERAFNEKRNEIVKLVQSWFDALRYVDLHREKAMEIMAESEEASIYEFKLAYDRIHIPDLEENLKLFDLESDRNIFKMSDLTLDFMRKRKIIKAEINTKAIFDPSVLEEVE